MDEEQYMKERLQDQIDWYGRKSSFNQKWYKSLQLISIVASVSIPFLTSFIKGEEITFKIIVGILALLVAVITAIFGLYKFQENWMGYRTICESLRHEKFLYLAKSEPYNLDGAFQLLVRRVESIISKENSMWSGYMNEKKDNNS